MLNNLIFMDWLLAERKPLNHIDAKIMETTLVKIRTKGKQQICGPATHVAHAEYIWEHSNSEKSNLAAPFLF